MEGAANLVLYLAAAFGGLIAGILTGVLPGLHINLVAVFVASLIGLNNDSNFATAVFLLAMSISHVFHEFLQQVGVSPYWRPFRCNMLLHHI